VQTNLAVDNAQVLKFTKSAVLRVELDESNNVQTLPVGQAIQLNDLTPGPHMLRIQIQHANTNDQFCMRSFAFVKFFVSAEMSTKCDAHSATCASSDPAYATHLATLRKRDVWLPSSHIFDPKSYPNSPYRHIPEALLEGYTQGNIIPIVDWWADGSKRAGVVWTNALISEYLSRFSPHSIKQNMEGQSMYGHDPTLEVLTALEKYNVTGQKVAVVGSETPWIEAILMNLGNDVTTIEFNVPKVDFDDLSCKDYFDFFEKSEDAFDCIVSFSSVEHSGLGRYL
jgi:hypothetical protein